MPPDLQLLRRAYGGELATRYQNNDLHSGSGLDLHGGVAAILFTRNGAVVEEMIRDCSIDTANWRFNDLAQLRFGASPAPDVLGIGTATFRRATAAAGAGTFLQGTYFEMLGAAHDVRGFLVAEDTDIEAGETEVVIPVHASKVLPSLRFAGTGRLGDMTWDPTWLPISVDVGAGASQQTREQFRATQKTARFVGRRGYERAIVDACRAAGATEAALFRAGQESPTSGISRCFVGDSAFEASEELVDACRLAVDAARIGGCDLFVGAMTKQAVNVSLTVSTWNKQLGLAGQRIRDGARQAVRSYFDARTNPFLFTISGIAGAVQAAVPNTRSVGITVSAPEPSVSTMFRTSTLPRYFLSAVSVH